MSRTENIFSTDVRTKKLNNAETEGCISALESPILQYLGWDFQFVDRNKTKQKKKKKKQQQILLGFAFSLLFSD